MKLIQSKERFPTGAHFDFSHVPNHIAQLALELMKTQPLLQGRPDGETSTGYPKTRPATPQEIVEAILDVATIAYAEFERRDLLVEVDFSKPNA